MPKLLILSILLNLFFILHNLVLIFFHLTFLFQEELHVISSGLHDLLHFLLVHIRHTSFSDTVTERMKAIKSFTHRCSGFNELFFLVILIVLGTMIDSELVPIVATIIIITILIFIVFEFIVILLLILIILMIVKLLLIVRLWFRIIVLILVLRIISLATTLLRWTTSTTPPSTIILISTSSSHSTSVMGFFNILKRFLFISKRIFRRSASASPPRCLKFGLIVWFFNWFINRSFLKRCLCYIRPKAIFVFFDVAISLKIIIVASCFHVLLLLFAHLC